MSASGARVRDDDGADDQRPKRVARVPVSLRIGTSASAEISPMTRFSLGGNRNRGEGSTSNPRTFKRLRKVFSESPRPSPSPVQRLPAQCYNCYGGTEAVIQDATDSPWESLVPGSEDEEIEEVQAEPVIPEGDDGNSAGQGSVAFLADTVLDCPICLDPFVAPVYQCDNGHLACGSCCGRIGNKCLSCTMPIGYNRCRGMEKVIEAARVHCPNSRHGCSEHVLYSMKHDHRQSCKFAPCSCPHPGCDYTGTSELLYTHFAESHSPAAHTFYLSRSIHSLPLRMEDNHVVLLQPQYKSLFIINRANISLGSLLNVICLAPESSLKHTYVLTAKRGDKLINFKNCADFAQKFVAESPGSNCLLIPSDFADDGGVISLDVEIQNVASCSLQV